MSALLTLLDRTTTRALTAVARTGAIPSSLDRLGHLRRAVIEIVSPLTQAQVDFQPAARAWSFGEVIDHLILTDVLYQNVFRKMLDRARRGENSTLHLDIRDITPGIGPIREHHMPYVAPLLSAVTTMMPFALRETMVRVPLFHSDAPQASTPRRGRSAQQLRDELASSQAITEQLLRTGLPPDFASLRAHHPVLGTNNAVELLDIMSAHHVRHYRQFRNLLTQPAFPA